MVQDAAILTMADWQKSYVIYQMVFNGRLQWPLTQTSRGLHYSTVCLKKPDCYD